MKKYLLSVLLLITLLVFPAFAVSAQTTDTSKVSDGANLFTKEERKEIAQQLNVLSKKYDSDIIVFTVSELDYDLDFDYLLERVHDDNGFAKDAVLIGISMTPDNREVLIQAYGDCQKYITDDSGQDMLESIVPCLKSAKYVEAVQEYMTQVDERLIPMLDKQEPQLPAIKKGNYLIDDANVLSDQQEQEYLSKLEALNKNAKSGIQLYVLTFDNGCDTYRDYMYAAYYLDALAAQNGLTEDTAIFAISLDTNSTSQYALLQPYGDNAKKRYFTKNRCQKITDNMVNDLNHARYTTALDTLLSEAEQDMNHKAAPVSLKITFIELLACMLSGVIYILILVMRSSGHSKATSTTYQEPGSAHVLARMDSYTHTTRTKHKIESSSSSGGGHSGGHSSFSGGGHSHGGSSHSSSRSKF